VSGWTWKTLPGIEQHTEIDDVALASARGSDLGSREVNLEGLRQFRVVNCKGGIRKIMNMLFQDATNYTTLH
jgi:hypothetical protein